MPESAREVAVALVCRGSRWLVARRLPNAHLGGLWEFPGGECQPNEQPGDAALRELREECGIDAEIECTLEPVLHEYRDRRVNLTPVLCRWRAGEPRPLGNDGCRWVSFAELRRLEMPPANARIIRRLEAAL